MFSRPNSMSVCSASSVAVTYMASLGWELSLCPACMLVQILAICWLRCGQRARSYAKAGGMPETPVSLRLEKAYRDFRWSDVDNTDNSIELAWALPVKLD